ncbi:MAG: alpha/beta hydrolase [Lachnospiraceae bacterium]|nr:alpha/beta hydrolase [Lachnospiraceae bacterium]
MKTAILVIIIILIVLILIVLLLGLYMVMASFVRNDGGRFDRTDNPPDSVSDPDYKRYYEEAIRGQKMLADASPEDVSIQSFDGLTLRGWFLPAKEPTNRYMICVHGYRAYGPYEFGGRMEFLMSLGCNLLFPDNRAHGRSDGKYIGFGNLDSIDCLDWCRYLIDRFGAGIEISLLGCSMGAATILAACGDPKAPKQIKRVCADCGFSSGIDEIRAQVTEMFHLPYFPFVPVAVWEHKLLAKYDLRERAAKEMIRNFKGKLLIVHGGADTFVPTRMAKVIYDAADCEKELLIVDGAKHVLSWLIDPEAYKKAFLKWFEPEGQDADPETGKGTV